MSNYYIYYKGRYVKIIETQIEWKPPKIEWERKAPTHFFFFD